ncbi:MAG: arylsulfatase [Rikenellaceae bacterium]
MKPNYFPILLSAVIPTTLLAQTAEKLPNIIYIMADDMGMGDLGCYGQRYIKTPGIDSLAKQGMIFTSHYSGSTVSAPSRCVLMTGKHTGHASIRGNLGIELPNGERYDSSVEDKEVTVAEVIKDKGYTSACIGKWGLGAPESEGHPLNQGFDYFFGYLGQANAHRYYPSFLWENNKKVNLDKKVYTHDLIMNKALDFIKTNSDKPFFLYLTPTIPHADLIVPKGERGIYEDMFEETPYKGGGYAADPKPKATFAAMISRLDRDVQRVMDLLKEKGIDDNTIVVFTSDNGTHREGGHTDFFNSSAGYRGIKRDLYEGGVRTPYIVYWKNIITAGSYSNHVSAFWDFLPTVCDITKSAVPYGVDGISFIPTLTGKGEQKEHGYLYFEFHEQGGKQSVLKDGWKLIRLNVKNPSKMRYELYDLSQDQMERRNLAVEFPDKVAELIKIMDSARTENTRFIL